MRILNISMAAVAVLFLSSTFTATQAEEEEALEVVWLPLPSGPSKEVPLLVGSGRG
jgi:hypothetical protein